MSAKRSKTATAKEGEAAGPAPLAPGKRRPFVNSPRLALGLAAATLGTLGWLYANLGPCPAGGDATLVHLPRMTFYHHALAAGRLPRWNEQADFGTPMLAEGQVGVFYPPHLLLYGSMEPQPAYTASLLLHFSLAVVFTYWCGRAFGLSRPAATLAAIVFVGQGFFIAHLTDPWSYTTGCWLPLVVLAVWRWVDAGDWRWLMALSPILGIQLLAGHFQLAFYTHVVVILLGAAAIGVIPGRRLVVLRRVLVLPLALLAGLALAAVQLVPTAELALWGESRGRGFDYLASFATHPLHLVNFLAPTLLHGNPFWEPIAWEPWRASAKESLTYVGLIPFGLAVGTLFGCWRSSDAGAKVCCLLVAASVALCVGPFLPGFRALTNVPGFGWFSATSRWAVVSGLFLSLLAGRGLDQFDPTSMGRWIRRYVAVALGVLAVAVVAIVLVVSGAERFDAPPDRLGGANLGPALIRHGYPLESFFWIRPSNQLVWMLGEELIFPLIGFGTLLAVSLIPWMTKHRRRFTVAVLLLTVADLLYVAVQLNRLDVLPRQPLAEQSPVLNAVSEHQPHRAAGLASRLPMAVSVRSLGCPSLPDMSLYWNRDGRVSANLWPESLPTVAGLPRWGDLGSTLGQGASHPTADELQLMRLTQIQLLVVGGGAGEPQHDSQMRRLRNISDPWLAEKLYGEGILALYPAASQWTLWTFEPDVTTARAWTFPVEEAAEPGTDPRLARRPPPARRRMLDRGKPARQVVDEGERVIVAGSAEGPSVLVLTDLDYPGWEAVLSQGNHSQRVPIEAAFGGWRSVRIPQAGTYRVTFNFRPRSARVGVQVSLGALLLWLVTAAILRPRQHPSPAMLP